MSGTIDENHFGTNMLFHTDRTESGSDFSALTASFGVTSIRYPGGTIAEQFFDPSNSNDTVGYNYFDVVAEREKVATREILPLSDYLEFIKRIDGTATIVFPTYRYFDQSTRTLKEGAEDEIRKFLSNLVKGEYGDISGVNIELGNEWYQSNFNWTAEEFGHLQYRIAEIISDEAESQKKRESVKIYAQGDSDDLDNQILAGFFSGNGSQHIDGVLAHIYGTNAAGNTTGIGGAIPGRLSGMMSTWNETTEEDLLLAITEWNVGESGEDTTLINGLMRSAPILRMFAEMIGAGVDLAHFWSMQTSGPAGLSGKEGTGSNWSSTGYLYSMMMNAALGAQLVETESSFRLRDNTGSVFGYTYTFTQPGRTNVFLSSAVSYEVSLDLDLSQVSDGATHIYFSVLTSAPGYTGTEYRTNAAFNFQNVLNPNQNTYDMSSLGLDLEAYETVLVTISYGEGVKISADQFVEVSDEIFGSNQNDTIDGGLGDDVLLGFGGTDILEGGEGNDSISGGTHHDTLTGGDGRDTISGDGGRDSILGGGGDDLIFGGEWHDSIWGGEGADTLEGGVGNDSIFGETGDDVISGGDGNDTLDGGSGLDRILGDSGDDYIFVSGPGDSIDGGSGHDTVSLAGLDRDVTIWANSETGELGVETFQFSGVEEFVLTNFSDRVSLSDDKIEVVRAGDGDDVAELRGASGATVYMDDGDDVIFSYFGSENSIFGGAGSDLFYSSNGSNTFFGGADDDLFMLGSPSANRVGYQSGDGHDVIHHFTLGRDRLLLDDGLKERADVELGSDGAVIRFSGSESITLVNVHVDNIWGSIDFV
jgi:Ca2+-binding RTX toxin-like protein